jgi:hypothetical protein
MRWISSLAAASVVVVASTAAHAISIGVNFSGGGNASSPAVNLAPGETAGVVPQSNFNNVAGGTGSGLALVDNTGAATGMVLAYTAGGTYSSIGGLAIAPTSGDEKLNTGFIFGNANVTVTGIPFTTYDVYVYELNDAAGRVETTTLVAPAVAQGPFFGSSAAPADAGHVDQNAATAYVYNQALATVVASPTANADYVRFTNLSGSTMTFTTSAPGNGYLNGFQIVQVVPEPAGAALLATGAAFLAGRRRRRLPA